MLIYEYALIILLAVIFVITCISQFQNKMVDNIRRWDLINFLPAWYFFAPRPITYDLHLLYRDEYTGGEISSWKEVAFSTQRKWWHFVWNPKKRLNKSFFDIFKDLMDHLKIDTKEEFVVMSLPYLLLLDFITNKEHAPFAQRTQFAIIRKEAGETEHQMLFVSFFHNLQVQQVQPLAYAS